LFESELAFTVASQDDDVDRIASTALEAAATASAGLAQFVEASRTSAEARSRREKRQRAAAALLVALLFAFFGFRSLFGDDSNNGSNKNGITWKTTTNHYDATVVAFKSYLGTRGGAKNRNLDADSSG